MMSSSCSHVDEVLTDLAARELVRLLSSRTFQKNREKNRLVCSAEKCEATDDLWCCMTSRCWSWRCGRHVKAHALEHSKECDHPLCISVRTSMIWCYKCDEEVLVEKKNITEVRNSLLNIQSENVEEDATDESDSHKSGEDLKINFHEELPINTLSDVIAAVELESKKEITPCGLSNLGNTCYMNAALQCLLCCKPLLDFFGLVFPYRDTSSSLQYSIRGRLLEEFYNMIEDLYSGSTRALVPRTIQQCMGAINPIFRGFAQHDSQEFLRSFLDGLDEGLAVKTERAIVKTFCGDTDHVESVEGEDEPEVTEASKSCQFSPIRDCFGGKLLSTVKCSSCKKVSRTVEVFMDLSLPIPEKHQRRELATDNPDLGKQRGLLGRWWHGSSRQMHILDCLRSFFSCDVLSGKNEYFCSKCNRSCVAEKRYEFFEFPEVLVLHLKRFEYRSFWSSKIGEQIDFPSTLDLNDFATNSKKSHSSQYRLFAVINHSGSVGGGHYTAYAFHGKWFCCNDSRVYPVPQEEVLNSQAYVLFYSRIFPSSRDTYPTDVILPANENTVLVPFSWILRLFRYASGPGCIKNFLYSSLCPHGMRIPDESDKCDKLIMVKQSIFEEWQQNYGGGPPLESNSCVVCELLNERRDNEKRRIVGAERKSGKGSGEWYVVGEAWLLSWRMFVCGSNDAIPEEIDNACLLDSSGNPKVDLRVAKDYRMVNRDVWNALLEWYGGGPILRRVKPCIYE